jgi:putative transposase
MEPQVRKPYPTDLTDAQWEILEPLVPAPEPAVSSAKYPHRELLNAIFYVNRTGCQWRMLPHDFPPWESVYKHFRQWRKWNLATDRRYTPPRSPKASGTQSGTNGCNR